MSKWLKRLLENTATKSSFESKVSMVLPVSNLCVLEIAHIDEPYLDGSIAMQSEPLHMNLQVLKKIEISHPQNRQNLLDDKPIFEIPRMAAGATDKSKITFWLNQVQSATTLESLEKLLKEFSSREWTLLDKRDLSEAYTPVAIKLINSDQTNKWQNLENLALLCWRPIHSG